MQSQCALCTHIFGASNVSYAQNFSDLSIYHFLVTLTIIRFCTFLSDWISVGDNLDTLHSPVSTNALLYGSSVRDLEIVNNNLSKNLDLAIRLNLTSLSINCVL